MDFTVTPDGSAVCLWLDTSKQTVMNSLLIAYNRASRPSRWPPLTLIAVLNPDSGSETYVVPAADSAVLYDKKKQNNLNAMNLK